MDAYIYQWLREREIFDEKGEEDMIVCVIVYSFVTRSQVFGWLLTRRRRCTCTHMGEAKARPTY
jgi:hypothetical protein